MNRGSRRRKREPLEVTLEANCVMQLVVRGYWPLKVGTRGFPDRLVVLGHGRHFWLEFKRRRSGSFTPAQRRLIPQLREAGEHVYKVESDEEFQEVLRKEGA